MAEYKKLTDAEVAQIAVDEIGKTAPVGNVEVEAQGFVICPFCDAALHTCGTPDYAQCCVCEHTFNIRWD